MLQRFRGLAYIAAFALLTVGTMALLKGGAMLPSPLQLLRGGILCAAFIALALILNFTALPN